MSFWFCWDIEFFEREHWCLISRIVRENNCLEIWKLLTIFTTCSLDKKDRCFDHGTSCSLPYQRYFNQKISIYKSITKSHLKLNITHRKLSIKHHSGTILNIYKHRRTSICKWGVYITWGVSSVCNACPILLAITNFVVTKINSLQTKHQAS